VSKDLLGHKLIRDKVWFRKKIISGLVRQAISLDELRSLSFVSNLSR